MNFNGKTAFITGAARGIGKAIAIGFAKRGGNVIICDVLKDELSNTSKEIFEYGVKVKSIILDISDEKAVIAAINESIKEFGQIHILVNNAAIIPFNNFTEADSSEWKKVIDVNILGTMYPTHAILPHMTENKYGRIVNIGSVAGVYGISYFIDYSTTKGAIIAFTKALSKLVADKGITVNCISPGSIHATPVEDGEDDPVADFSFMGRAGTPEEIANAVIFAASDEASYMTGQNILVDGGRKKM